jgi:uncharacterized phage-associated protein
MSFKYPEYREEITTQLAAYLLAKHGGKMEYIKLIKLLYFIDREALNLWGEPLTFDTYYSMDNGPVLSQTYNRLKPSLDPEADTYWDHFISTSGFSVNLIAQGEVSKLSRAVIELADRIYQQYGHMDRWDLIDNVCHRLPEWKNPHGSSIPISYEDILRALGKTDEEIREIDNNLRDQAYIDLLLG